MHTLKERKKRKKYVDSIKEKNFILKSLGKKYKILF